MTDTTALQSTPPKKERLNLGDIIGGTFEDTFETVTGRGAGFVNEGPVRGQTLEELQKLPELNIRSRFPEKGELTGFQGSDAELIRQQREAVAGAERILRQSRAEFIAQEEIRLEVAGMSEDERNDRLGLNTSYRKQNTQTAYHEAALYRQKKAEQRQAERGRNEANLAEMQPQRSALEAIFEGGSGTLGGGASANLSATGGNVG